MRNGVPATVVDLLHENFAGLLGVLDEAGEVSLRAVADGSRRWAWSGYISGIATPPDEP